MKTTEKECAFVHFVDSTVQCFKSGHYHVNQISACDGCIFSYNIITSKRKKMTLLSQFG